MTTILLYIVIMGIGIFLARKGFIPNRMKNKLQHFQNFSLMFLLGVLGYKLGSDDKLLADIDKLGVQSVVIAAFSIGFSILFVHIFYKGDR